MSIDIVVTYLDDTDKTWQEEYNKYKKIEVEKRIIEETNAQAFGEERIRNWDNMKYWFRGIETNCKWVNKIYFVVQKESQIPSWLNIDNPKIQVIYHDQFIPKELLPTFNAMIIETFVPLIEGLSENYICFDDDIFVLNPIKSTMFFRNGIPVHKDDTFWGKGTYSEHIGAWGRNLDNSYNIEKRYGKEEIKYAPYHLPNAHIKSLNKKILKDNWEEILESFKVSKFRNKSNIGPIEMYSNITKRLDKCIIDNTMFNNSKYIGLSINTKFDEYWGSNIVCFNDTEKTSDFEIVKQRFLNFLDRKLPNISQYEKGGQEPMDNITLIIPCHDLEDYIEPCLKSICEQENNLGLKRKVIFICDTCKDNTNKIIGEYMSTNKTWNYEIIDVQVGSPGLARNIGLDKANSEYIWFVDGDDHITCNNAIDELYRLMKKDDMDIIEFKIKSKANPEGAFGGGTVWRCILSSRIIGDMRFNDRQCGEDNDFIWNIYHKQGAKYGKIELAPYFYTFPREGSQMWKKMRGGNK